MATAEHPLEGSPNYCKRGHDLFPAFWRGTVEWDRWMENLNLDHPKLFQRQRANDSTREKPTRSPVCQSPLCGSEQWGISQTTAEEGSKAVQSFTGRPWESRLWRSSETLGSCVCLLSSCLNPQPLLGCSQCMIVYVTLT